MKKSPFIKFTIEKIALLSVVFLLAGYSAQANTPDVVVSGSTDLSQPGTYTGGAPTTTSDVTFGNQTYSPATFTLGATPGFNLNIGTLDDFSSTAISILPTSSGTITLNGGVNSQTSMFTIAIPSANPQANDLLFVGVGDTLTLGNGAGGALTLSLVGVGNLDIGGTATIGAAITGGNGLTKTGSGTLTLSGTSAYTGANNIDGGTVVLTGTLNAADTLNLAGGTFTYNVASRTQTFAGTTISAGQSAVTVTSGTIALGGLTLASGSTGTVNFAPGTGAITMTGTTNIGGILGGYATFSGTTWAVAPAVSGGAITGLTTYTVASAVPATDNGQNVDVTASVTVTGSTNFNSIRFNTAAATTLTLTGSNFITTGGILNTNNVGNNQSQITGGTLAGTPGSGGALYVTNNHTQNSLGLNSIIANNGASATSLVISDVAGGNVYFQAPGNNTYSGGTYVNSGLVSVNTTNSVFGTGAVNLGAGLGSSNVTFNYTPGGTATVGNAFNINGGPGSTITLENTSGTLTMTGTVTLANDLLLENTNSTSGNGLTLSGAITGTGNILALDTSISHVNITGTSGVNFTGTIANVSTSSGSVILSANLSGSESLFQNSSASQLTVSGTNNNTGTVTVRQGTLEFTATNALYAGNQSKWTASNIIVQPGGILAFNTSGFTAAQIATLNALGTSTGGFENGSYLGLDTSSANFTDGSVITNSNGGANAVGLVKIGANTLTLTVPETYTGTTTISAGTLQIGNGVVALATPLLSPSILDSSALLFSPGASTQTYGGNIGGGGAVQIAGNAGGTVVLAGTGIYTGATTVTSGSGTLDIASQFAVQNSTLTPGTATDVTFDSSVTNNAFTVSSLANQNLTLNNTAGAGINLTIGNVYINAGTTYSGVLSGSGGLTQNGYRNTLTLTGSNTYSGTTTVSGGTLNLGGAGAAGSIGVGGFGGPLVLGGIDNGGILAYTQTGTVSQSFNGTTIAPGMDAITESTATQTLNLGAITGTPGGTVDISSVGTVTTTNTTNVNGILGGYATYGGRVTWAVAPSVSGSAITGLAASSYTTTTAAGTTPSNYTNQNIDVTSSVAPTGGITPNSLRFNQAGNYTLTLTGLNTVVSGGILVTSTSTGGTISGGILVGSAGGQLAINTSGNGLNLNSQIEDNGGPTALTLDGNNGGRNFSLNNTNNSFSGGLFLNGGGLSGGGSAFGVGTVTLGNQVYTGAAGGGVSFGGNGSSSLVSSGLLADADSDNTSNGITSGNSGGVWTLNGTGTATFAAIIGSYPAAA